MSYSEKRTVDNKKGKTTYEVRNEKAELVDESSPRLHAEITISLGNFQFLKLGSHRSSNDREQAKQEIIDDMVSLKKEFMKRHSELFE